MQPERTFKAGQISATIWRRENLDGFNVVLEKTYKDREGNWKKTNNLSTNDLPKAELILKRAYEFIVLKEAS